MFDLKPGDQWRPSQYGGFLYLMEGADPVYFHLLDPEAIQEEMIAARKRITKVQRTNTVRKLAEVADTEKELTNSQKRLTQAAERSAQVMGKVENAHKQSGLVPCYEVGRARDPRASASQASFRSCVGVQSLYYL